MILMALCAVLCGADSWVDVAEWAEDNEAWLRRYLVLAHGTPSHDTFGRVFRLLDGKVFEARFRTWIGGLAGAVAGVVAIDGKTACGSKDGHNTALHTISALVTDSGLCLGQEHTRGKGNEIPAIKALLDALAGGLREFVADGGSWVNKELREHWPKLAGVGMIERQRDIKGAVSTERAFYIGSQGVTSAESFAKAARSHWGIENRLHWVLDVTFREDDRRVRKDHAPHNFDALRKFALALLRQDKQYPKRSLRSRRKTAERLPDYRAALLGLSPRR